MQRGHRARGSSDERPESQTSRQCFNSAAVARSGGCHEGELYTYETHQSSRLVSAEGNPNVRLVPLGLSPCSFFSISLSKVGPVTVCYQNGGLVIQRCDLDQCRRLLPTAEFGLRKPWKRITAGHPPRARGYRPAPRLMRGTVTRRAVSRRRQAASPRVLIPTSVAA